MPDRPCLTGLPKIINTFAKIDYLVIAGLMPERCNSIANALKLRLSCINPSKRLLRRRVTVSPQWYSFLLFLCSWTVMYLTGLATVISHTSPYYIPFVCHGAMQLWRWRRHQMETCSVLLAICVGKSPVIGEFPSQMPVTRAFMFFFDLRLK